MFFKNPFMSERSEFKRVFKKHTNVAGGSAKNYRYPGSRIMVFVLKSF